MAEKCAVPQKSSRCEAGSFSDSIDTHTVTTQLNIVHILYIDIQTLVNGIEVDGCVAERFYAIFGWDICLRDLPAR